MIGGEQASHQTLGTASSTQQCPVNVWVVAPDLPSSKAILSNFMNSEEDTS